MVKSKGHLRLSPEQEVSVYPISAQSGVGVHSALTVSTILVLDMSIHKIKVIRSLFLSPVTLGLDPRVHLTSLDTRVTRCCPSMTVSNVIPRLRQFLFTVIPRLRKQSSRDLQINPFITLLIRRLLVLASLLGAMTLLILSAPRNDIILLKFLFPITIAPIINYYL